VARPGVRSEATRAILRQAALDVAIEYGVRGITHRRVAAAAGVALGSASYHYEHIDELMYEAFASWVESQTAGFAPGFANAETEDELVEAVMHLLTVIHGSESARILLFEIYAQSVRDPRYHQLVENWSRGTRTSLERLYGAKVSQQLEAAWEGIGVQIVMGTLDSAEDAESLIRLVLEQERIKTAAPVKRRARSR
jgi:TetR/AcrR family transcriptional regulator, regulator of biofilm formation and stress response